MHERLRAKVDGRESPHEDGLWYRRGFTEFAFEAQLEHAYHHLNVTWGCRHATLERTAKCSQRDFRNWEKFPLAFRELLPDTPRAWQRRRCYPAELLAFLTKRHCRQGNAVRQCR